VPISSAILLLVRGKFSKQQPATLTGSHPVAGLFMRDEWRVPCSTHIQDVESSLSQQSCLSHSEGQTSREAEYGFRLWWHLLNSVAATHQRARSCSGEPHLCTFVTSFRALNRPCPTLRQKCIYPTRVASPRASKCRFAFVSATRTKPESWLSYKVFQTDVAAGT
jgi:hypothetical protein